MSKYEVELEAVYGSEDAVVNNIREAIARAGYQTGNCEIIERNDDIGAACVIIHGDEAQILNDDRTFCWNGLRVTVIGIYHGNLI